MALECVAMASPEQPLPCHSQKSAAECGGLLGMASSSHGSPVTSAETPVLSRHAHGTEMI